MSKRGGRGGNRNYNNSNGRSGGESSNPNLDQALDIGSKTFNCNKRDIQYFTHNDPFNPKILLEGGLCRGEGNQFGSIVITHVRGELLTMPEVIHCVPSLQMPYPAEENSWASARQNKKAANQANNSPKQTQSNSPQQFSTNNPFAALADSEKQTAAPSAVEAIEPVSKYIQFPACIHAYIATKWNGTNITFFKYRDNEGNEYVTAKPRPFATLRDMHQYDCTLSLTKQALGLHPKNDRLTLKNLPDQLSPLLDPSLQSFSLELCGSLQPHLVKYDFDVALKPLFVTKLNGAIVPHGVWVLAQGNGEVPVSTPLPQGAQLLEQDIGPRPFTQDQLISLCDEIKAKALELNEQYRAKNGISTCFYFESFAYEGKVLYLLNDKLETVARNSIFKIKPQDIEMYHWEQFDAPMQGKTIEALAKVFEKELEVNEANIKAEIDLSERGWYRFSRDIMTLVSSIPNLSRARLHKSLEEMLQTGADQQTWFNEYKQRQKIVLTVGIPGSGKSTFAEKLQEQSGWVRLNQDELGTRRAVEVRMEAALKQGLSVIVDRTNFDYQQRNNWVKMAAQYRINTIFCVLFDIDAAVCKSRISVRKNHPTIPEGDSGHVIVDKFTTMLVPPRRAEGFCEIFTVRTDDDIARVMNLLAALSPKI